MRGAGLRPGILSIEGGSCFVSLFPLYEQQVSIWHVIQVLLDGEEDAKNVCRLDQIANGARGLCARVDVDDVLSFFLF